MDSARNKNDRSTLDLVAQTRAVYEQIAPGYAARRSQMPENLRVLVQETIARAPGRQFVDIGCGAGRDMQYLETQGCIVTGIDLSAAMLCEAAQIVRGNLVEADCRQLPIDTSSQDGAWACASLLHLPKDEMPQALMEISRVLVPGGVVMLSMKAGAGERFEDNPYDLTAPARFIARYEIEELTELLAQHELTTIMARDLTIETERWIELIARRA